MPPCRHRVRLSAQAGPALALPTSHSNRAGSDQRHPVTNPRPYFSASARTWGRPAGWLRPGVLRVTSRPTLFVALPRLQRPAYRDFSYIQTNRDATMRTRIAALAAAAFAIGSLTTAAHAQAAQNPYDPNVPTNPGRPATVQPLDCNGGTGEHGCGPGFFWRNGGHGWACYPCG